MPSPGDKVRSGESVCIPNTGTLRLPRQDISDSANLDKMDALSFTPWRVTAEHRPLGNIMRVRKEVSRHSSILRHRLNGQQRAEPSGADQILTTKLDASPTLAVSR